eukprot:6541549-Pyramimonas_sp.AAC.1
MILGITVCTRGMPGAPSTGTRARNRATARRDYARPPRQQASQGPRSGRRRWARKEWARCPTAVTLHFEQDSLSAPPRPAPIRDRRPPAQQRP